MPRTPHKIYKNMSYMQLQGRKILQESEMCEINEVSLFLFFFCNDCKFDNKEDIPRCSIQRKILLEDREIKKLECKKMVKVWKSKWAGKKTGSLLTKKIVQKCSGKNIIPHYLLHHQSFKNSPTTAVNFDSNFISK